jgi:hypothetical protein
MKSKVLRVFVATILSVGIWLTVAKPANAQAKHVRWDIMRFNSDFTAFSAGGTLSATAVDESKITLMGTGTFVQPASDRGTSNAVTGGGTWNIQFPTGNNPSSASGTYTVEGLVQYTEAPGTFFGSGVTDNIGDVEDTHAGLGILSILYSDGDRGILLVSCNLNGMTFPPIYEGATATKGFVDYFAPVLPGDPNATVFHFEH